MFSRWWATGVGFESGGGCDPILMPRSGVETKQRFWKGEGKDEESSNEGG